jgi:hypothetical protein
MTARVTAMLRRQRGQALTEFLAVALALVPLFLLLPMIAKYQDMAHITQLASRYVAFDAMTRNDVQGTWKDPMQMADEVRRRFFSNVDAPLMTHDVAGDFRAHQNPFWRTPDDLPLLRNFSDVTVTYGHSAGGSPAQGFEGGSDGTTFPRRAELGLQAKGLYTGNVSVRVANLSSGIRTLEPFDQINLIISRGTSVLIDPWPANTPQQVEGRISASPGIFPVASLHAPATFVSAAVTAIDWPGAVQGPRLGELEFWRDVVPDDRLRSSQ